MATVRMSAKGQVVIPRQLRERFGLRPGKPVYVSEGRDAVAIRPAPEDPIEAAFGMFRKGPALTKLLLEERAREREREDRKPSR